MQVKVYEGMDFPIMVQIAEHLDVVVQSEMVVTDYQLEPDEHDPYKDLLIMVLTAEHLDVVS